MGMYIIPLVEGTEQLKAWVLRTRRLSFPTFHCPEMTCVFNLELFELEDEDLSITTEVYLLMDSSVSIPLVIVSILP